MRLAMAQMGMSASIDENLRKTLDLMERAKAAGAELIFFPELQLTSFSRNLKSGTPPAGLWTPRRLSSGP